MHACAEGGVGVGVRWEANPQSKVRELNVALVVEQKIVGLDVTVNEAELVDRIDRHDSLANIETRCKDVAGGRGGTNKVRARGGKKEGGG